MEILEQLGTKVKKAVQKIEELQARIVELEEINAQYEKKMKDMLEVMGPLDDVEVPKESDESSLVAPQESEESSFVSTQESDRSSFIAPQEGRQDIYKQQY